MSIFNIILDISYENGVAAFGIDEFNCDCQWWAGL